MMVADNALVIIVGVILMVIAVFVTGAVSAETVAIFTTCAEDSVFSESIPVEILCFTGLAALV